MRPRFISGTGLAIVAGLAVGMGSYAFLYAKGYSYLTNEPRACANCHVMQEQYSGWVSSSHHHAASCNDCHTPHALAGKYAAKTGNGFRHSFHFTTRNFPDPIRITTRNRRITEEACRSCHDAVAAAVDRFGHGPDAPSCISCHRNVGHLH